MPKEIQKVASLGLETSGRYCIRAEPSQVRKDVNLPNRMTADGKRRLQYGEKFRFALCGPRINRLKLWGERVHFNKSFKFSTFCARIGRLLVGELRRPWGARAEGAREFGVSEQG